MKRADVLIPSHGETLAAWHFTGAGDDFAGPAGRPCVVMAGGWGTTRDSGSLPYAERLAAAGLDVLLFDYRHFGASTGEPRQLISVRRQREDFTAAIAFAREIEGVDAARIVLWGSSYSGGHVIVAAAGDGRVAAVISQVPAVDGLGINLMRLRSGEGRDLLRLIAHGLKDLFGSLRGRPPHLLPVVAAPGRAGAMTTPDAEPGYLAMAGPTWRNEFAARAVLEVASNRPTTRAADLPCPILFQLGEHDAICPPSLARKAAFKATGRAEVRAYPIGHFDIYVGDWFERAIADELHFLRRHLGANAGAPHTDGRPSAAA